VWEYFTGILYSSVKSWTRIGGSKLGGEKSDEDSIEVKECESDEKPKREKQIVHEDYEKIK